MRLLIPLSLLAATTAATRAAAEGDACTAATAKASSIAAIIAGEGNSGDCVTVRAIAWKGALYDSVAQIYAEPKPARDPGGRGNRIAYFPPGDAERKPLPPGGDLAPEATDGFSLNARHITVTGTLGSCRSGAIRGGRPPLPYVIDESACHHPGGTLIRAVAVAVEPGPPVERLVAKTGAASARLSPLAEDSVWTPRFAAIADELLPALASGDEARWRPLLGGKWLGEQDAATIRALIAQKGGVFDAVLHGDKPPQRVILGWRSPGQSAEQRAAAEAWPHAEAVVCWSARPDADALWPLAAFDADNRPGRPYACARITYSIYDHGPVWRAYIESDRAGLAEPAA